MLVHPCHVDTMYVERHLFDHKSLICCDGSQHHLCAVPTRIQCFPVWPARHSKCAFVIESICQPWSFKHSVTPSNCLSFFARAVPAGSCHRGSSAPVVAMDVLQHILQSVSSTWSSSSSSFSFPGVFSHLPWLPPYAVFQATNVFQSHLIGVANICSNANWPTSVLIALNFLDLALGYQCQLGSCCPTAFLECHASLG